MVKVLAVYALAGTAAPAVGWLVGGGIALLFGRGDAWLGPGYLIMSGPPYTGRVRDSLLHSALSALKAALAVLVACGVALMVTGRPGWSLVLVAFLPVTFWRIFELRSLFRGVGGALDHRRSESDREDALRLRRQRQMLEVISYVFGALLAGALVVHRP